MKHFKKTSLKWMAFMAVCLFSFSLSSCGDDDDDGSVGKTTQEVSNQLVGIWGISQEQIIRKKNGVKVYSYTYDSDSYFYFIFHSNGTFEYWDGSSEYELPAGMWSNKKEVVTLVFKDDYYPETSFKLTTSKSFLTEYSYSYTEDGADYEESYIDTYIKIGAVPSLTNKLLGIWKVEHETGWRKKNGKTVLTFDEDATSKQYMQFNPNGMFENYGTYWYVCGIWASEKNSVKVWRTNIRDYYEYKILSLTNSQLVYEYNSGETKEGEDTYEYYEKITCKKIDASQRTISIPLESNSSKMEKGRYLFRNGIQPNP